MRSQRATADVRIVTSSNALVGRHHRLKLKCHHRTQDDMPASLPRAIGFARRYLALPASSPPEDLSFRFNCTRLILIPLHSVHVYFSPQPILRPLSRRDHPRINPSCLIAYRGSHCDQSTVCAIALSGAGRYIARRYTAIVVPLSHCCVTGKGQEDAL